MTADELAKEFHIRSIHVVSRLRQQARYIAELECELDDLRAQVLSNDTSVERVAKTEA